MIHIFEKTCKTFDNKYGIKEIDENPFINNPCIITILALPISLKKINGSLRQVANLVNPNIDDYYDPNRRILGLGFGEYNEKYGSFSKYIPSIEEVNDFINKYFCPLFIENNKRINTLVAMKRFRNITFLTYCNGAKVFKIIEELLKYKMYEVGYSYDDIGMILSQICLAAITGDVLNKFDTCTLAFSFGDINDSYFEQNIKTIEIINKLGQGYICYGSSIGLAIASNGEHSFKKLMSESFILSSKISSILNTSLDNAIENKMNKGIIIPLTYEKIENAFNRPNKIKTKTTTRYY